jgi:hypothetical protein
MIFCRFQSTIGRTRIGSLIEVKAPWESEVSDSAEAIQVGDRDLGPRPGEPLRVGTFEAACRAGNNRHFRVELSNAPPSFDDLIVCFRSRSQSDALAGNGGCRSGSFAKTPQLEPFRPNEGRSQMFIFV